MRSTMPRPMISSASSRALHWLMGRSESAGISQARAMIWQICSGVIRAGRPDLGASRGRSHTSGRGCSTSVLLLWTPVRSELNRRQLSLILAQPRYNLTSGVRRMKGITARGGAEFWPVAQLLGLGRRGDCC